MRASLPDGDYACTLTDRGTAYPPYLCRVATTDATRLVKLEGSQRVRGTITFDAADRVGFHGEFYCAAGGCTRPIETSLARQADGAWLGDIGEGVTLALVYQPAGMYGGAGYGADAWTDGGDASGGVAACAVPADDAGTCGGGARRPDPGAPALGQLVAIVDRSPPVGTPPPDLATLPLPERPPDAIERSSRGEAEVIAELAELEERFRATARSAADRPMLLWRMAMGYREQAAVVAARPRARRATRRWSRPATSRAQS